MMHGSSEAFPLALLLIFGIAKLLAELFERFGQPGIAGEILAGVVLGPYALNWVQPNNVLQALAEMGIMFLLFRVGLEVRSSELIRVGGTALLVALLGVLVPFVAGWALMSAAGASRIEAIFVGAAMVATSVGITAGVLKAGGLLEERAAKVILAAAVIDDVLGLIVLAFVSSLAEAHVNPLGLATTAVMAIAFTALIAKFGTPAMRRVVPQWERKFEVGEVQFNLAIILLFALALLAGYVGVAAIIGAFLAGMALSESVDQRVHDLTLGISELLVPFFLAGIGMKLNISVFQTWHGLVLTVCLIVAAILTKMGACGLAAIKLGATDAWRVGAGMVPRGEVGMIVAQIGLGLGVISQSVYAVVVAMAVATTIVAPPLVRWAFREKLLTSRSNPL